MYGGVPVVIGAKGVERIIEIDLNATEKKAFQKSVGAVKSLVDAVVRLDPSLKPRKKKTQPARARKIPAKRAKKPAARKR